MQHSQALDPQLGREAQRVGAEVRARRTWAAALRWAGRRRVDRRRIVVHDDPSCALVTVQRGGVLVRGQREHHGEGLVRLEGVVAQHSDFDRAGGPSRGHGQDAVDGHVVLPGDGRFILAARADLEVAGQWPGELDEEGRHRPLARATFAHAGVAD